MHIGEVDPCKYDCRARDHLAHYLVCPFLRRAISSVSGCDVCGVSVSECFGIADGEGAADLEAGFGEQRWPPSCIMPRAPAAAPSGSAAPRREVYPWDTGATRGPNWCRPSAGTRLRVQHAAAVGLRARRLRAAPDRVVVRPPPLRGAVISCPPATSGRLRRLDSA